MTEPGSSTSPRMMPIYTGSMIISKFRGKDSDCSLGEWKRQLNTLFNLQNIPVEFRADFTLSCLEGTAKRQILILPQERRKTAELIFKKLEELYGDQASASVLRAQFFNITQEPQEDIDSFALRIQEHFARLKRRDARGLRDEDVLLRDVLIDGLRDPAMRGEFRSKVLLNDDVTFEQVKTEMLVRERAYGAKQDQVQCFATRGHSSSLNSDLEQMKRQLKEEMNDQIASKFKELSQCLISEIRTELQQASPRRAQQTSTQGRNHHTPDRRAPWRPAANQYDEQGRPICNNCAQSGHTARYCRVSNPSGPAPLN